MADDRLPISGQPNIEFESVAALSEGKIKGCKRVFRDRLLGTGAAVAEKQRTYRHPFDFTRTRTGASVWNLVEIEIADGLAGIGSFFGFL